MIESDGAGVLVDEGEAGAGDGVGVGAKAGGGVVLHVDHIKPRSKFPELELSLDNTQVLCADCNLGKGAWDDTFGDPNYGFYNWYAKVTLTVTTPVPDGYQALWTGTNDDESTEPTNTVTMDSDKVVTVTFVKDAYDLTVEVIGPGGSVSPIGTHTYPRGTVVNLTAYPDEGHRFKQWTGTDNDASAATTNTVTMYSDKTVTAEFERPATITVPGDYSTIQEAIVAARDRDKIIIGRRYIALAGKDSVPKEVAQRYCAEGVVI